MRAESVRDRQGGSQPSRAAWAGATMAGSSHVTVAASGTIAGMPKKPVTSNDELARMLWQVEADASEVLMQQMLDRLGRQTFVGGKRVAIQKLPRLPNKAATTVHRVKISLHGAKPPVWRRPEIPSATRLDLVHEVL